MSPKAFVFVNRAKAKAVRGAAMSDAVPKGRRPVGIMKTQLCKELKEAFSQQTEFAASVVASDSAVQALLTTEEGWRQQTTPFFTMATSRASPASACARP